MTKYNVHIYREMKLYFPGIEAESPQAAADLAAKMDTADADDIVSCDGIDLAALVDVDGDDNFEQSVTIAFEPQRMLDAAPRLLAALSEIVRVYAEYPDETARQIAESAIAEATGKEAA
ncbi:hypothetical protein [Tautonia marina]|uniref:hypothetical protein n=1 Tax=Tautonia marina TaxID=2653855 RepID=UPI001261142B|nr:hypothetical protein [Tautonia marina]